MMMCSNKTMRVVVSLSMVASFAMHSSHAEEPVHGHAHQGAKQKAMQLQHENIRMIAAFFNENPTVMLSIHKARIQAMKIMHEMPQLEDKAPVIADRLARVLTPVQTFLGGNASMMRPTMEPLLLESFGAVHCASSPVWQMLAAQGSCTEFLNKNVTTKAQLQSFCSDFIKFFGDLENSLPEGTKNIIAAKKQELIQKAKQGR